MECSRNVNTIKTFLFGALRGSSAAAWTLTRAFISALYSVNIIIHVLGRRSAASPHTLAAKNEWITCYQKGRFEPSAAPLWGSVSVTASSSKNNNKNRVKYACEFLHRKISERVTAALTDSVYILWFTPNVRRFKRKKALGCVNHFALRHSFRRYIYYKLVFELFLFIGRSLAVTPEHGFRGKKFHPVKNSLIY